MKPPLALPIAACRFELSSAAMGAHGEVSARWFHGLAQSFPIAGPSAISASTSAAW